MKENETVYPEIGYPSRKRVFDGPRTIEINRKPRTVQTYYKVDRCPVGIDFGTEVNPRRTVRATENQVRKHVKAHEIAVIRLSPKANDVRLARKGETTESLLGKARRGKRTPDAENRLLRAIFGGKC